MPSIEAIRKFNRHLIELGDEPRIASARGEPIEEPREPQAGATADARESEAGAAAPGTPESEPGGSETAPAEPGAEEGDTDAGPGIDELSALLAGEEGEPAGAAGEFSEDDPFAGIDLDFGDEAEGAADEFEGDVGEAAGEAPEEGAGEAAPADEPAPAGEPEAPAEPPPDTDEGEPESGIDFDDEDLDFSGGFSFEDEPGPGTDEVSDAFDRAAEDPFAGLEGLEEEDADAAAVESSAEGEEGDDEALAGFDLEEGGEESDEALAGFDVEEGAEESDEDDELFAGLDLEEPGEAGEEGEADEEEEFQLDLEGEPESPGEAAPPGEAVPEGELEPTGEQAPTDEAGVEAELPQEPEGGPEPEGAEEEDFDFGGEEDEGDFADIDDFSLGDFGAEFGVIEEGEEPDEEELNPAVVPSETPPEAEETDIGPGINLTDRQFEHLKETLDSLPLNLRIAVEEIIGGGDHTAEEIKPLVDLLVQGAAPKRIARVAGGLKGERIRLPANYEVRSGVIFEDEKRTFAYRLRYRYLPMARTALIVGALLAGAIYLAVTYVYRPLYARSLYLQGLEEIAGDRYTVGNEFFREAREVWESEPWYYRFADAFIGKRQYRLAQQKFDDLLERFPNDREGLLRYGDFESRILGDYPKADRLFDRVLEMDVTDYDGLLGRADNFLRWADEDPSQFEPARLHYARLFEQYGATDEIMQRFMRYFVRTDNLGEVEPLVEMFEEERPNVEIDPEIYSETAGYLLDYERIDYIRPMLRRAREQDRTLPDVHYQLARFFGFTGERGQQETALRNARNLFPQHEPLSRRRLGMHIDTYTLSGDFYADGGEYLTAEQYYVEAIDRYESARASDLLDIEERFGRMYAQLGDIYYYQSAEFDAAREQFIAAEQNAYATDSTSYKLGWIAYRNEDYDEAVDRFESVSNNPHAKNIRYAMANTHYYRGNYFASQAYLHELIDILQRERARIGIELNVDGDDDHRNLIKYKVMANNNLGVVYHRLFEQTGDRDRRGDSLYHLTNSTQDATNLLRDPETAVRADATDLAHVNQQYVLFPDQPYTLRIYRDLPVDLEDTDFFPAQM